MKSCSKCSTIRPLDQFSPARHTRDGRASQCKPCKAAYARRQHHANRPAELARKAAYRAANSARHAEYNRAWRAANPDIERQGKRRREAARRARMRNNLVLPFTDAQLYARLSMWSGCWVCGTTPNRIDHVKPIAAGGAHILANLRPICEPCNLRKKAKWPVTRDALARP
jgi:5-methylcytosine-specific restriction endonuclease McrA